MVCATEDHLEHTERLMQGFIGSIGEQPIDAEQISERARRTVAERRAYLWQLPDRRIVSLSAIVRETPAGEHLVGLHSSGSDETATQPNWLRRSRRLGSWQVGVQPAHGPRQPDLKRHLPRNRYADRTLLRVRLTAGGASKPRGNATTRKPSLA